MNIEEYRKKYQDDYYEVVYNEEEKTWDIYYSEEGERLGMYLPGYLSELEAFEDLDRIVEETKEKIRQSELNYIQEYPQIPIDPETKARLEAEELEAQKDPNWLPY